MLTIMAKKISLIFILLFLVHPVFAEPAENSQGIKSRKIVYLTFDADMTRGMAKRLESGKVSSWYSPGLVSYLEEEHIPATIFVAGMFAELYAPVVRGLAQTQGIVIGNHTYDHPAFESPCYGLPTISKDADKKDEITKTQEILKSLIGYSPKYFRYPGLCRDEHDDRIVEDLGLTVADDGIASGDAFSTNSKNIVRTVLSEVKDGSVVIMHLGGPNAPETETALKEIVPTLQLRGYEFRTL